MCIRDRESIGPEEELKRNEFNNTDGWLAPLGVFDREDQRYIRERIADQKQAHTTLRNAERELFAIAQAKYPKAPEAVLTLGKEPPKVKAPTVRGVRRRPPGQKGLANEGDVKRQRKDEDVEEKKPDKEKACLLYTSPSPRDRTRSRMPSSA
eukprot:TRINITY_DN45264_c0_g1_i1.p1 TRINITY_DN45264_c0_g1~~TRINITY_DN45264_c0_g1_i1.p1  ORF type:complete len:152 (+),score=42.65 TRINITY_DN45264_c0_g1_i1:94-549(+)